MGDMHGGDDHEDSLVEWVIVVALLGMLTLVCMLFA